MQLFLTREIGGLDAGNSVREVLRTLASELKSVGAQIPSRNDDKIDFRLAVSGEISRYEGSNGYNRSRILEQRRTARIELTIHQDVWRKGAEHVRKTVVSAMMAGLIDVDRKARERGLDVDVPALLKALSEHFKIAIPDASTVERADGNSGDAGKGRARKRPNADEKPSSERGSKTGRAALRKKTGPGVKRQPPKRKG